MAAIFQAISNQVTRMNSYLDTMNSLRRLEDYAPCLRAVSFALLYGIPHLPVVLLQLPTHGLKGLTEPAQLVRALIVAAGAGIVDGQGGLLPDL